MKPLSSCCRIGLGVWILATAAVWAENIDVSEVVGGGRFALAGAVAVAPVHVEAGDHEVVRIAARDLTLDIERVTGRKPLLLDGAGKPASRLVMIGSMDRSKSVQALIKAGKLDVSGVRGEWEAFTIQVVKDPLPGVDEALVIAGSDRRGTAYGVYELSRSIGVSPWYWWADVVPAKREQLHVSAEPVKVGPPGVKYRGIFINDEMWGIRHWAEGHFATDEGCGLGPKSYEKIFELLLRLRANYIWPAMHGGTKAFHLYEGNKHVADRYAIVMGGSHTEVMLRNQMHGAEWDAEHGGEWNYFTQSKAIYDYWVRGVKKWGRYENLYTVGMRGRDDEPMFGGDTKQDKIDMMERILKDQREILANHVNPDVTQVAQTLVPYSEVLDLYDSGMKVPEDVILTWPDDNFGYIRRLPTKEEQKRSGGSGVYHHIQWINGATSAYPWLNTMPPSLLFAEMNKAWQYQCKSLWVLNVGDIKPGEIGMEFFLDMAWNPDRWTHENIGSYLEQWAARDLSEEHAAEISKILKEYYQLAMGRRPEHLVMHRAKKPVEYSWFSHQHHGDEAAQRLARYDDISRRAEAVFNALPKSRRDAFYQLVLYPVQASAWANQKIIHADRSMHDAATGRSTARVHALRAQQAQEKIIEMTDRYTTGLEGVGDKWRYMIHWASGPWGAMRHQHEMPQVSHFNGMGRPRLLVVPEGDAGDQLADLSVYTQTKRFIDLFNTGKGLVRWEATAREPWLKLDQSAGTFEHGLRLWVDVDWETAPKGATVEGVIEISSAHESFTVKVPVFNPEAPLREEVRGYIESHGYVSMEAEHFTRRVERGGATWTAVDNLGVSGDSVIVVPATLDSRTDPQAIRDGSPSMEYDVHLFHAGELDLELSCLPTHPVSPEQGVRLAVSVDDGEPVVIGIEQRVPLAGNWTGKKWDVLKNERKLATKLNIDTPGKHTLKVWMVDPGVILDKMVIHTQQPEDSYFGPPESYRN